MTGQDETQLRLDDNVLSRLANLICGDDSTPYYRRSFEIENFFRAAGWTDVGELEGYRKQWVLEQLHRHRNRPDRIQAVVLRLADRREYLDEKEVWDTVVAELNELLAIEGFRVNFHGTRPQLVVDEPMTSRPASDTPIALTTSIAEIVSDQAFGQQLQSRLDEALVCWQSGAPTAAIIMLGSVMEGVLYDVARNLHTGDGKAPTDHLESLINLAQVKGWIAKDLTDYVHVLRDHRNLVHPKKQWTQSYSPKDGTVRIAWNVVVAALNDLAAVVKNPPTAA
ncbi:hypothetical protein OU415_32980 [Saccharopolyspora sp. WRP15-2]|uniref:DUF4145 domain-containing protein n=1 Tax=Saccharopolyspora oryzae TaxID=2997343 RepID=A0ABT4V8I7_9PSEU|nr:hypothetical protein [Saccharopolyspora oryzae]MDA3630281.1 hypothetical protein [Saccharopolyspora oryzae]